MGSRCGNCSASRRREARPIGLRIGKTFYDKLGMPSFHARTRSAPRFSRRHRGHLCRLDLADRPHGEGGRTDKFSFRILALSAAERERAACPPAAPSPPSSSKDPARRKAGLGIRLNYATGPAIGQTHVATYTGYMPGNQKALDDPALLGRAYGERRPTTRPASPRSRLPHRRWYKWGGANGVKDRRRHPGGDQRRRRRPTDRRRGVTRPRRRSVPAAARRLQAAL